MSSSLLIARLNADVIFLPSFLPFRISLANILISILETKQDFVTVVASAPIPNRERIDFKLDFENVN